MIDDQIGKKLDLLFNSINEIRVAVKAIEVDMKHVIEDKIKHLEDEIKSQKESHAIMQAQILELQQAPDKEASLRAKETRSIITKVLLTSVVLLLFGILSRYVIKEIKDNIINEVQQTSLILENNVAVLPKNPVDDGEYCETEEEEKKVDDDF